MASINFPIFLQRHIPKFSYSVILALLEWTLIALLFLNCSLFFFITKFTSLFDLQTPCIPCSLFGFKISFDTLVCDDHVSRISQLKRPRRKRNKKVARRFDYIIIYGPPWRVVEYTKNGSVVHKKIKEESEKDCVIIEEGYHEPDFCKDKPFEPMHQACVIDEERLVPVELIDEVTVADSSIWFNEEKRHKREFTGKRTLEYFQDMKTTGSGKTKLRNEAKKSTSVGNFSSRKDQVDESIHNSKHQSRNTSSYSSLSSLFEVTPIETIPFSNPCLRSESPSPKFNEEKHHKREKGSFEFLQGHLMLVDMKTAGDRKDELRNEARKSISVGNFSLGRDQIDESIHQTKHQNRNTSSYSSLSSLFEVTPIETTHFSNPCIRSQSPSPKYNELEKQKTNKLYLSSKSLDSSLLKRNKEYTGRPLHSQDQNTSSIFEITPVGTASLANPDITSEPMFGKQDDEPDASMVKGNEEEMKGEILNKLDESLNKIEEERCSIIKKVNELEQRLLILQKEELESKNVIEETKPKSDDYKSLSDFLHCEMNYSTNDLVSLGNGYNQRRDGNLKMKRYQPSLLGFKSKRGLGSSFQVHKFDAGMKEQLAIQVDIDTLSERLQHVNADKELIKQCVKSLMDGVEGISFAEEILNQVATSK